MTVEYVTVVMRTKTVQAYVMVMRLLIVLEHVQMALTYLGMVMATVMMAHGDLTLCVKNLTMIVATVMMSVVYL